MYRSLLVLLSLTPFASAATCGGSAIPFRFEVLPSGTPVLGCGSPQCFGAENGGRNILHDSRFVAGPSGEDGFMRDGDLFRSRSRHGDAPAQQANCPNAFESSNCASPLTWVGGFLAQPDGSLRLQCCQYSGLRFGAEVGRPIVHAGEVYSGGEVLRDGRQTGFDLISDVKTIEAQDGSIAYELTVTRMNCLPDPAESFNDVDISGNDISRILDKVGEVQQSPSTGLSRSPEQYVGQLESNSIQGSDTYIQTPSDPQDPNLPPQQQEQYVQVGEQVIPVTSAGYYYPVASGVPACFTGDTVVDTASGQKTMDQLKIGDLVMTSENNANTFTRVIAFMHRLPETEAAFIRIATQKNFLKLTPQHFIYKTQCNHSSVSELIYAEDVRVGDCIYEAAFDSDTALNVAEVKSVSVVQQRGVYAPMTETGDMFVNNIYASCHNVVKSSTLTHTFLNLATSLQNKLRSWLGSSEDGHLPATSEFFLKMVDYIVPHKY